MSSPSPKSGKAAATSSIQSSEDARAEYDYRSSQAASAWAAEKQDQISYSVVRFRRQLITWFIVTGLAVSLMLVFLLLRLAAANETLKSAETKAEGAAERTTQLEAQLSAMEARSEKWKSDLDRLEQRLRAVNGRAAPGAAETAIAPGATAGASAIQPTTAPVSQPGDDAASGRGHPTGSPPKD